MFKVSVDKVWECENEMGFVFVLNLSHAPLKKVFLTVDRFENQAIYRLNATKPSRVNSQQNACQQILRKYLNSASLTHFCCTVTRKKLQLIFQKKTPAPGYSACLSLDAHHGLWDLVVENIGSVLRKAPGKLYTKRKIPDEIPLNTPHYNEEGFSDVLEELFITFFSDKPLTPATVPSSTQASKEKIPEFLQAAKHSEESPDPNTLSHVVKKIKRRLKTLNKARSQILSTREKHAQFSENLNYGNLLKEYAHFWQPGLNSLHLALDSLQTQVNIPLEPHLNLGEQIEYFYQHATKDKKGFEEQNRRLAACEEQIDALQEVLKNLANSPSLNELTGVMQKYEWLNLEQTPSNKTQFQKTTTSKRSPIWLFEFKEFPISIFVGKTAVDNDLLTKKAKSHDLWLHVTQTTGSHVVIPGSLFKNLTSEQKERALFYAGILALHYSSLKNSHSGEVYFTEKANLKKKKDLPPGRWLVQKARSIKITYTQDDLDYILTQKK